MRAQGAEVELPSLAEARSMFDAWLLEDDLDDAESEKGILMRALGLGRTG